MTTTFVTSNSGALALAGYDYVTIVNGASVTSGGQAISTSGDSNVVSVFGGVHGALSGIYLNNNNTVHIGQNGSVSGISASAIELEGNGNTLTNLGEIMSASFHGVLMDGQGDVINHGYISGDITYSDSYGLYFRGVGASSQSGQAVNTGVISGFNALGLRDGNLDLLNSGTISGLEAGIVIESSSVTTSIYLKNSGEISGNYYAISVEASGAYGEAIWNSGG